MQDWDWIDLPFFILVASMMGAVAAAFTRALVPLLKNTLGVFFCQTSGGVELDPKYS